MEYLKLQNSELIVSRICMGGCPMGGYGWGKVQEEELIAAVRTAIDQGITFFDTADTYGLGQSEITLGKALGTERKNVIVATKFGVRVEGGKTFYDNSPEWIEKAVDASLNRLGTDYIDLYQIHYRDGVTPISVILDSLEKLRNKGKIRYFGLSNIHLNDIKELEPYRGRFLSVQNEYSLASRQFEEDIFSLRDMLQLTPLTWGSLGQGILTGKYDKTATFGNDDRRSRDVYVNFHGDKLLKNLHIVDTMRPIAEAHGKPVAAVALRFIMDHIASSVVLCGCKRPSQVLSNLEAVDWHLTGNELFTLDEVSK